MQRFRYNEWGIPRKLLDRYFKDVDALKQNYAGEISIRSGLEVDFIEGAEHLALCIFNAYPCDFLLGSVHCIPSLGWHHFAQYANTDPELAYKHYFETVQAALQSGLFQSLAHLDAIWRYIPYTPYMHGQLSADIAATAVIAKKTDVALEINAAGYAWALKNAKGENSYAPFEVLLNSIAHEQTSITIGSDAHSPDDVARLFPEIIQNLHAHGITECLVFEGKKKKSVTLG
jgi:histidinol-phosphatase (PHP family)